jgi:uncharacterized protein (TIGR04255 family)
MQPFTDEVYPNSPLAEVVFEIRFPGELQVECERHLFWEKIRREYPAIRVPHPNPEKALALVPYRFDRLDKEMTVMVAMNSLTLSALKYPGFKEFKKELIRISKIFGETFKVKKLSRASWRYVNVIPFVRENGLIPLGQFLKLGFKLPSSIPERFKTLSLAFDVETKGGRITTRLETLIREDSKQEAILLDFNYGKDVAQADLCFADVEKYIDEAHTFTRQLFEDLITDEYRQYLRGDVL